MGCSDTFLLSIYNLYHARNAAHPFSYLNRWTLNINKIDVIIRFHTLGSSLLNREQNFNIIQKSNIVFKIFFQTLFLWISIRKKPVTGDDKNSFLWITNLIHSFCINLWLIMCRRLYCKNKDGKAEFFLCDVEELPF